MTGRQLVTSPESEESSPSTSVNTNMKLLSYLQREKLKVPQKRARQEEEKDDTEEKEVEQYFVEMRALEVEEIEKDDKDEEEDEDEDLEKIPHTQQKCTLENQNRSLIVKFKVGTAQTTQSADDQPEALAVIHDEQPLNHVSPVIDYEDLPLTDDDICNLDKIVESQAASIRQSATEKDNVISATVQS
ncbi:hypothetical protein ACLB2K_069014 [Fragaria x ananassa]